MVAPPAQIPHTYLDIAPDREKPDSLDIKACVQTYAGQQRLLVANWERSSCKNAAGVRLYLAIENASSVAFPYCNIVHPATLPLSLVSQMRTLRLLSDCTLNALLLYRVQCHALLERIFLISGEGQPPHPSIIKASFPTSLSSVVKVGRRHTRQGSLSIMCGLPECFLPGFRSSATGFCPVQPTACSSFTFCCAVSSTIEILDQY